MSRCLCPSCRCSVLAGVNNGRRDVRSGRLDGDNAERKARRGGPGPARSLVVSIKLTRTCKCLYLARARGTQAFFAKTRRPSGDGPKPLNAQAHARRNTSILCARMDCLQVFCLRLTATNVLRPDIRQRLRPCCARARDQPPRLFGHMLELHFYAILKIQLLLLNLLLLI